MSGGTIHVAWSENRLPGGYPPVGVLYAHSSDSGLRGLLVDEGYFPPGPGFEIYNLPRKEFNDFLAQQGEKLLEFMGPWHGRFEIYAIRWE